MQKGEKMQIITSRQKQNEEIIAGLAILGLGHKRIEAILQKLVQWINTEKTFLLPKTQKELLDQIEKGLSVILLVDGKIAAHATAWELGKNNGKTYYEIGTVIVGDPFRRRGFTERLGQSLVSLLGHEKLITTSANTFCVHGLEHAGMKVIDFDDLPENIRQETCCCPPSKMGCQSYHKCNLKNSHCKLMISE